MPYKYLNLHINYKKFITLIFVILPLIINPKVSLGDDVEDKLAELCNANGVSGFEKPVRDILKQYWQKYGVNYKIDGLGNLIGKLPNHSDDKPTILIMAHMDEVGFILTKIDDNGFIRANALGGWLDHVIWAKEWVIQVGKQAILAISGIDAPHVLNDFTKTPVADRSMMFLDTGFTKEELLKMGVRPGLPIIPLSKFKILKKQKRYSAKAFDDRAGLAIMLDLMKLLQANKSLLDKINLVFAATVQEELGMRGSKAVYESLKPDLVINIEAGIAKDYPDQFTKDNEPKLGYGPSIFIYDGSMMPNQNLVKTIIDVAKKNNIPFQLEMENSYGQDASCLQSSGQGMPAVNIGIPVRYVHSHTGILDRDDYDNTLKLLKEVLFVLDRELIQQLP
ncbi:M42 family metallopeptidase [Rickettsia tamurae]|uniref:Aminopeptidase ysdC n=1 Tax=Rickettsia tamurae subsp. buchneri TaxID=1462938 RepID=A0A8E1C0S4_9RICK|nr:M42 family metallopeptidase [Rickettsia tamurae]KDO03575.1 Putative aminopeptidase ysdC [Rickettsia tamurae subsp. buchneri]